MQETVMDMWGIQEMEKYSVKREDLISKRRIM